MNLNSREWRVTRCSSRDSYRTTIYRILSKPIRNI